MPKSWDATDEWDAREFLATGHQIKIADSEPVICLSHCPAGRLTHASHPEAMLIRGSKRLEFIDVIEPIEPDKPAVDPQMSLPGLTK
jgi:hypothetical protein